MHDLDSNLTNKYKMVKQRPIDFFWRTMSLDRETRLILKDAIFSSPTLTPRKAMDLKE